VKRLLLVLVAAAVLFATPAFAGNSVFTLSPGIGAGTQINSQGEETAGGFVFGVNGTYIVDRWLFDLGYGITTTTDDGENLQAISVGFGTVFGTAANIAGFNMGVKPRALARMAEAGDFDADVGIYPYLIGGVSADPTGNNLHGLFGEVGTMIPFEAIDQWTRVGARVAWISTEESDYRLSIIVAPVMAW
jgi:hypothetical protein